MLDQHENFRNVASKVTSLTANPPFRWEEIDHSLVRLRLANLADEKRIHFDNRNNLNANTFPSLILNEERIDQRIRKTYEIYCGVWQKQGRAKSADFIRTVYFRGIVPGIHARASAVASEFRMWAIRTSFSPELREAHLRSFHLKMLRFEDRWKRSMEAEAKECQHAAKIAAAQAETRGTPNSATDEAVGENGIAAAGFSKITDRSGNALLGIEKAKLSLGNGKGRASKRRAKLVAKVTDELLVLKDETAFETDDDFDSARARFRGRRFYVFDAVERFPRLKSRILTVKNCGRAKPIALAQEIVSTVEGVSLSTSAQDWNKHKPGKRRSR